MNNTTDIRELERPTFEKAIIGLANIMWETGSKAVHCLTPSRFGGLNESSLQDDVIVDELHVTHFTLAWEEKGKIVRIVFYKGSAFGACFPHELKKSIEFVVNLETGKFYKATEDQVQD
jgi:hypothetical protein